MGELLRNLATVFVFAWLARSLLGAEEITWPRTIVATLIGFLLGAIGAAAVLVRDLENFDAFETIRTEFFALALVLAVSATMAVMVFIELMFASRRHPHTHRRVRPFRTSRRWLRMWLRGFQVTRIAAHHGIAPLLGLRRGEVSARTPAEIAPTHLAVTQGSRGHVREAGRQLLVTRPDLLPREALAELGLLHADVSPIPEEQVKALVLEETGRPVEESSPTSPGSRSARHPSARPMPPGSSMDVKSWSRCADRAWKSRWRPTWPS